MTGAEQPNAALVRKLYAAFAARDFATIQAAFAPDATWTLPGRSPLSRTYRGVDSILRDFMGRLGVLSGGTFRAEATDVVANDRHAIALQHATGRLGDRTLDVTAMQHFRFEAGKIAEVHGYYSDQYALDEFWTAAVAAAAQPAGT